MSEPKVYRNVSQYPHEAITIEGGYRLEFKNYHYTTAVDKIQKAIERSVKFKNDRIVSVSSKGTPSSSGPETARDTLSTMTPRGKKPKKVESTEGIKDENS